MTRFRENKMEAQNFKKSFRTEDVGRSSPNLVGLWGSWAYMLSQNLRSIRPEMDFWRIFENFKKKSFSSIGAHDCGRTGSDINMRISLLETRNTVTCPHGARFSIFISTSGLWGLKVKKVKIAFFQNRSSSIACSS